MPTPRASRGGSATETMYGLGGIRVDDDRKQGQVVLLPTPTASEGEKGGPNQAYSSGGATLSGTVPHLLPTPLAGRPDARQSDSFGKGRATFFDIVENVKWGMYEAAINRWERIIGRRAPAPVRNDGRNGKPRLNPELTEWMMGWPAGHVTDPAIGLSRAEQLKACGNGVVPQQAAAALREMLARPGVPEVAA